MDFKNHNGQKKLLDVLIVIGLLMAGVSILALVAGPILHLLGLQYASVGQLVLYFLIASVVSYLLNLLFAVLYALFLAVTGLKDRLNKTCWLWSLVALDALSTFVGFAMIDSYMESVSASLLAVWTLAIVFALLDKKKEH